MCMAVCVTPSSYAVLALNAFGCDPLACVCVCACVYVRACVRVRFQPPCQRCMSDGGGGATTISPIRTPQRQHTTSTSRIGWNRHLTSTRRSNQHVNGAHQLRAPQPTHISEHQIGNGHRIKTACRGKPQSHVQIAAATVMPKLHAMWHAMSVSHV